MNAVAPSEEGLAAATLCVDFVRHMSCTHLVPEALAEWCGTDVGRITIERTCCPGEVDPQFDAIFWPLRTRGIRQKYCLRGVFLAEADTWYASNRIPGRVKPLLSELDRPLENAISAVHPVRRIIATGGRSADPAFAGAMARSNRAQPRIVTLLTILGSAAAVSIERYSLHAVARSQVSSLAALRGAGYAA